MALYVLVVEVEVDEGDAAGALLRSMTELRGRLRELDVPVRRAWAGGWETAAAVAALHPDGLPS